jgi:protein involved in polysaccharide export with SLBB domain
VPVALAWAQALPDYATDRGLSTERGQTAQDRDFSADRDAAATSRRGTVVDGHGSTTAGEVAGVDVTAAAGLYSLENGQALSLPGPVDADVYEVGPGDILLLQLWGKVSRSVPIEVGPEGTVLIPGMAVVHVAGRVLADVRADLLARMGRQYRGVSIDLRLARPRTFRVYVTGQVKEPGALEANGAMRVADVVSSKMMLDAASRRRIEVIRTDGTRDLCDLELFLQTGEMAWNPWLRDGDVIQVPTATEFVWAEGALARPGRYELGMRDSLRTLLRLAGDPLPAAEVDRVLMVHFRDAITPESLWVDLRHVYARTSDHALEDGDRLYVTFVPQYHQQQEAAIVGEVQRPGVYPIHEGHTRLSDLVSSANGFQLTADLSSIRVHRRSPAASERDQELDRLLRLSRNDLTATEYEVMRTRLAGLREDYRVDWSRLQRDRDLDLLLRDGDSVRVERLVSSVRIDGEVRRPGMLNFVAGQRVDDYVAQAGGYTDRAWQGKVRVTRSVTGQTLLARNVRVLDPGDFVWVPERPDVTVWQQTKEILTALAEVATIVIAIRSVR